MRNKFDYDYKDLIESFNDEIFVREVIHDLRWELEAYYEVTVNSFKVRIVFFTDIISPRKVMNINEFKALKQKIVERYNYVKNIYGIKKSF